MKKSVVLLFLFVVGCSVEPEIPTSQLGSVSGHAYLYSAGGSALPGSSGIIVTEIGTGKSTKTNDLGEWTINNLPEGTYTFSFAKEGYGAVKIFDFNTFGTDTICTEEVDMTQPTSELINFQRFTISLSQLVTAPSYSIIGAMQPPFLKVRAVVLCISTDSTSLANDPASAPVLQSFVMGGSGYDGGFDWSSTSAFSANEQTFPQGTKVYATAAISGQGPEAPYLSNYFDPSIRKQIFTALGRRSQILSAIMP